jgi:hypothetical protein
MKFTKFIPLEKIEEQSDGTLSVYGLVTAEEPDLDKEVCDYATTKPLYQEVAADRLKITSAIKGMEPSLMPLREMHQTVTQGAGRRMDFDDDAKKIRMGFSVVDPTAVKKWKAGCFVGFSQGGDYVKRWADPVFKGCMRYTARPLEVSAVDVPCLPSALVESMKGRTVELHKANGGVELIKVGAESAQDDPVAALTERVNELAELVKSAQTKRVADEDLPASAFAYVGDPSKTETWKLPIKFSTEEKTKAHIRNALARFSQTEGIPASEKAKVRAKIVAAAKQHGIDVSDAGKARISAYLVKMLEKNKSIPLVLKAQDAFSWIELQRTEKIDIDADLTDAAKLLGVEATKAAEAGKVDKTMDENELKALSVIDLEDGQEAVSKAAEAKKAEDAAKAKADEEAKKAAAVTGGDGGVAHAKVHAMHHAAMCKLHKAAHEMHKGLMAKAPDDYQKSVHAGHMKIHKAAHAHHLKMHKAWSKTAGIEPQAIEPISDGDGASKAAASEEFISLQKKFDDLLDVLKTTLAGEKIAAAGASAEDLAKRGGQKPDEADLSMFAVTSSDK